MDSNICLKAVNIDWDVDCAEDLDALPKEVQIPAGMVDPDEISDYLSDLTGFCHEGFELRKEYGYPIKLCYGYEQNEDGSIFHAFEAIGPDESPVDMSIDKKLLEVLEADEDNFDWDWLFVALPDSVVSKIRNDAFEEFSIAQKTAKQDPVPCMDTTRSPIEGNEQNEMTDSQFNKCLALLQDVGLGWDQAMAIMNVILVSSSPEDAASEVAKAVETFQ